MFGSQLLGKGADATGYTPNNLKRKSLFISKCIEREKRLCGPASKRSCLEITESVTATKMYPFVTGEA